MMNDRRANSGIDDGGDRGPRIDDPSTTGDGGTTGGGATIGCGGWRFGATTNDGGNAGGGGTGFSAESRRWFSLRHAMSSAMATASAMRREARAFLRRLLGRR